MNANVIPLVRHAMEKQMQIVSHAMHNIIMIPSIVTPVIKNAGLVINSLVIVYPAKLGQNIIYF